MHTTHQPEVALITGASRGIGKAIALDLADAGFSLALIGRDRESLTEVGELCGERGAKARIFVRDLSERTSFDDLVKEVQRELGGVNILVNNAGCWLEKPISRFSLRELDLSIDLNLRAAVALTHAALPYIEEGISSGSHGAIINIGSISGQRAYPGGTAYCATKAALESFSRSLFEDVRERGIKVSVIEPGLVDTDLHAGDASLDPERMIRPADIAAAVRFVISSPATVCPVAITLLPQRSPKISKR